MCIFLLPEKEFVFFELMLTAKGHIERPSAIRDFNTILEIKKRIRKQWLGKHGKAKAQDMQGDK